MSDNQHDDDFDVDFGEDVIATEPSPANQPTAPVVEAGTTEPTQPAEATEVQPDADQQVDEAAQAAAQAEAEKQAAEAKAKAEKKAADEQALTEFKQAADAAVQHEDVDSATGELPEALKSPVTLLYSKLSGAPVKKRAKDLLQTAMQAAMLEGPSGFLKARSYLELFQAVEAIKADRQQVVRTPVDPTEDHVNRVTAMYLAANLAVPGDDVAEGWQEQVQDLAHKLQDDVKKLRDWLVTEGNKADDDESKAEQPEVSPVVLAALRIAQGRGPGATRKPKAKSDGTTSTREPFTGERGDIGQHITEAFANVSSGTYLTVSDMVNFTSSQYGGDKKKPSPGAIAARLFPRGGGACTIEGITPTETPKKGAVKN